MTHASIPKRDREIVGVIDSLVRFSVGIEDLEDLVAKHGSSLQSNQLIKVDGKIMAIAMMVNAQHLFYREDNSNAKGNSIGGKNEGGPKGNPIGSSDEKK